MRSTFRDVAIPDAAIFIRAGGRAPRRTPTAKKQKKPASSAQARDSPLAIHPATQAKNTPNAAKRSIFLSPVFNLWGIISRSTRFVISFSSASLFSFLFECVIL